VKEWEVKEKFNSKETRNLGTKRENRPVSKKPWGGQHLSNCRKRPNMKEKKGARKNFFARCHLHQDAGKGKSTTKCSIKSPHLKSLVGPTKHIAQSGALQGESGEK